MCVSSCMLALLSQTVCVCVCVRAVAQIKTKCRAFDENVTRFTLLPMPKPTSASASQPASHINANWLKCACAHVWVCVRPLGELFATSATHMRLAGRFQVFKLKHFIVWLIVKAARPQKKRSIKHGDRERARERDRNMTDFASNLL